MNQETNYAKYQIQHIKHEAAAMTNAITRIKIKDFLVFKGEFAADFCPGVNVFIGGNGSGKTTLLKVLYAACNGKATESSLESINNYLPQYLGTTAFNGDAVEIEYSNGSTIHWRLKRPGIKNGISDSAAFTARMAIVPNAVYIPEKDLLEHSKGLLTFIEQKQTGFSLIYKNVLLAAQDIPLREQSSMQKEIGHKIAAVIGGDVHWDKGDGSFYTMKTDGSRIPFATEASGYKKLGYLGLLLSSGQLEPGAALFWDEPENSLNPELIPTLTDILLELQRGGIQIFVATHSYDIARWLELNRTAGNMLRYFNLRKTGNGIFADVADDYVSLPSSVIEDAGDMLLRRVAEVAAQKAGVKLK
jgi:energy-coupling factor transporter ATP-binding protein EcfA2